MTDVMERELAILKEDYDEFDDAAHAARLHWASDAGGTDYFKPQLINGRRQPALTGTPS